MLHKLFNLLINFLKHKKEIMKKLYLTMAFVLLLANIFVYGQVNISGTITDKQSKEKLEGVNVFIQELQRGTISGENGFYEFKNLPTGSFSIQFTRLGYKTIIERISADKLNIKLNINLLPTNIEMQEVVVVGNSISTQEKIPIKVETLTAQNLRRNNSETLVDALSKLPGIWEMSNGVGISKPVIRGMYGYRTATIIDGIKFDNQQFQDEHGFGLDEIGIGKVEIIQGPESLIYGSGALGGVINLIHDRNAPVGKTIGNYNLKIFSNTLGANTSIGLEGTKNNLSWQFHLGGESNADYLNGDNNRVPNTRFTGGTAKGLLNYTTNSMSSDLEYIYSYHIYGVFEPADLTNPKDQQESHFERGFDGPHHIIGFHIISLQNLFFTGNSKIKLNLGFQNNHRQEIEGSDQNSANIGELDLVLNTFSFDAGWITPLFSGTELSIGTQGSFQNNKNDGTRILIPDANTNELSLYSYLKENIDKIDLEGGIRYDTKKINTSEMGIKDSLSYFAQENLSYSAFNAAAGGSYSLNDNIILKINFATGFRAPDLAELTSNGIHEGTTRYEIGNPNMNLENNLQTDIGAVYQTSVFRMLASYFYNKIKNYIYLQPSSQYLGIYQNYFFRQSDASIQGGELSIDIKPNEIFDFTSAYSFIEGKKYDGSYLPFMPANKIVSKINIGLPDWSSFSKNYFAITVSNYLDQNKIAFGETRTPGYSLLDVSLGSRLDISKKLIDATLSVTNLFGKDYIDHLSLLKPYGIFNMGRNIVLTLNYSFGL